MAILVVNNPGHLRREQHCLINEWVYLCFQLILNVSKQGYLLLAIFTHALLSYQ